jgi:mRNA interferase MazF
LQRGELWWADLGPPAGERPVVLLSRNEAYAKRASVTVAPVTTRIRGIRSEVALGSEHGLPRPSVANLDDITTIRIAVLSRRVSLLPLAKISEIEDALQFTLALPGFKR